jgi:uncharacterized membrane protein HdeD (DUF308 family)
MNLFLLGAVTMGFLVAGLSFLRFWRETRDRLFLAFAVSFFVEAVNRGALAFSAKPNEGAPFFYLIRLFSYLVILVAIADKNRAARALAGSESPAREEKIRAVDGEAVEG